MVRSNGDYNIGLALQLQARVTSVANSYLVLDSRARHRWTT